MGDNTTFTIYPDDNSKDGIKHMANGDVVKLGKSEEDLDKYTNPDLYRKLDTAEGSEKPDVKVLVQNTHSYRITEVILHDEESIDDETP